MVILLWWFCSFQWSFCSFSIFMLISFETVCLEWDHNPNTPLSLNHLHLFVFAFPTVSRLFPILQPLCQALLLPLIMNEAFPKLKSLAYFLVLFQLNVTGWRLNGLSVDLFQGLVLRKVLLQNYLFPNKKTNQKNDLAELGVPGKLLHTNTVQRK